MTEHLVEGPEATAAAPDSDRAGRLLDAAEAWRGRPLVAS